MSQYFFCVCVARCESVNGLRQAIHGILDMYTNASERHHKHGKKRTTGQVRRFPSRLPSVRRACRACTILSRFSHQTRTGLEAKTPAVTHCVIPLPVRTWICPEDLQRDLFRPKRAHSSQGGGTEFGISSSRSGASLLEFDISRSEFQGSRSDVSTSCS
jgi:hypothetical protein